MSTNEMVAQQLPPLLLDRPAVITVLGGSATLYDQMRVAGWLVPVVNRRPRTVLYTYDNVKEAVARLAREGAAHLPICRKESK